MSNEIIKGLWNSVYFQTTFSQPPDAGSLGGVAIPDTTSVPDNDYSLQIVPPGPGLVDHYDLVELGLETDIPFTNPYDKAEIELMVLFTAPSGKRVAVGAF